MTHTNMTHRVWPVGTMVVLTERVAPGDGGHPRPVGACGVIIKSPQEPLQPYRVRFPDGGAFSVAPTQMTILKHYQEGQIGDVSVTMANHDLYEYIIYKVVVGSRAYGLDHEGSDIDLRGIYLPPADVHWSIYGVPEQLERPETDECYWELSKFIKLALKANPNVLECLYSPLVEHTTELGEHLLNIREVFLSKMIYQTYNRYVMSQFKQMTRKREAGEDIRPKHAMHLIRLLLSGLTILRDGFVPLNVDEYKPQLLAIKHNETPWEEVDAWRQRLHTEFDTAFESSTLPERPNYAAVNEFLIHARRVATTFE